jgi:ketosteroid isomerase-like protein
MNDSLHIAEIAPAATRSADKLITELFDIIDGCRWEELGSVFAEDCVYSRPGYEPIVGLAQVRRFYQQERIVASGGHAVECTVSDVGAAACWGRFHGTSKTGDELDEGFADTYRVRDGKIVFRKTYFYRAAM